MDLGGYLTKLLAVLACVVSAEQELAAAGELHAEVGLGTAPVATVNSRQRRAWGNCSGHLRPHSFLGVMLNVTRVSKRPVLRLHLTQHPITADASH